MGSYFLSQQEVEKRGPVFLSGSVTISPPLMSEGIQLSRPGLTSKFDQIAASNRMKLDRMEERSGLMITEEEKEDQLVNSLFEMSTDPLPAESHKRQNPARSSLGDTQREKAEDDLVDSLIEMSVDPLDHEVETRAPDNKAGSSKDLQSQSADTQGNEEDMLVSELIDLAGE